MRERGFTLLEVLVAFAILAVAATVLMNVFSQGTRQAALAADYGRAAELAESKLAALGIETPLEPGEQRGRFAEGFAWTTSVEPYEEPDAAFDPDAPLRPWLVSVTVFFDHARRAVTLATLRLEAAP